MYSQFLKHSLFSKDGIHHTCIKNKNKSIINQCANIVLIEAWGRGGDIIYTWVSSLLTPLVLGKPDKTLLVKSLG
jgi:hypothetical protein